MYFFYIDESGNTGTHLHPAEPVHWVVAIAVHNSAVREIEAEMAALAARYFGSRAHDADFEFHGGDLFSGRRACHGLAPAARVDAYRSLAALLARYRCRLFVHGIDKAAHRAREATEGRTAAHPHALAFELLVERIDCWLESRQPGAVPHERAPAPVIGLLVADEQKEVDRETIRSFARWRRLGGMGADRQRTIRFLVDTVHYIPSMDSWLLQLADCVSYLRNRYEKVLRGKILLGHDLAAADQEIVSLWERYCAPVVESEVIIP